MTLRASVLLIIVITNVTGRTSSTFHSSDVSENDQQSSFSVVAGKSYTVFQYSCMTMGPVRRRRHVENCIRIGVSGRVTNKSLMLVLGVFNEVQTSQRAGLSYPTLAAS